jgi:serine/threonine protein kinase
VPVTNHRHCIAHRDLKADNVLVCADGTVKLADFGASVHVFSDTLPVPGTLFGSPYFLAPEVLQRQQYGLPVDIWAFGCTVLQMVSGQPPWSGMQLKTLPALLQAMQQSKTRMPPLPSSLNPAVRELLVSCFKWDPQQRPNVLELLSHELCNSKQCAQCKCYTGRRSSDGGESKPSSSSNIDDIIAPSTDNGINRDASLLINTATSSSPCSSFSIQVDAASCSSSKGANPYATRVHRSVTRD